MSFTQLPDDLPAPRDDGAADHLPGLPAPTVTLPATSGAEVALDGLGAGRTIVYVYPMTGRPGVALPDGWDEIPGARGCTPEACAFRDHHADLLAAGAVAVYGLSSQDTAYQREVVERLNLPFAMLADPALQLADELRLPTFEAGGVSLYKRITLVINDGVIEHAFYPIFPPDEHAAQVLRWLGERQVRVAAERQLDRSEVVALYESVGWTAYTRDPDQLMRGLDGSHLVLAARDQDGSLIGLARTISDGETVCYLQDILVRPDRQGAGVGRELMQHVLDEYSRCRAFLLSTDGGADDDARRVHAFYRSAGLVPLAEEGLLGFARAQRR